MEYFNFLLAFPSTRYETCSRKIMAETGNISCIAGPALAFGRSHRRGQLINMAGIHIPGHWVSWLPLYLQKTWRCFKRYCLLSQS